MFGSEYTFDQINDFLNIIIQNEKDFKMALEDKKYTESHIISRYCKTYPGTILEISLAFLVSNSDSDESCSICLDEFYEKIKEKTITDVTDEIVSKEIGSIIKLENCERHFFHKTCIENLIKSKNSNFLSCPICKKQYGIQEGS